MTDVLGKSLPRPDAFDKVTGAAHYPGDLARWGMLHLRMVLAHRPHALIRSIDTSSALAHPGVIAVLTADDVPHNAYGLIEPDQPVLCFDKVRFVGDRVALVVGESKRAAEIGADLVSVDYFDLPVVASATQALLTDAPLIHEAAPSNLLLDFHIRRGDVADALARADVVLTESFETGWQEHAYLQPEAGIAYIDEQDRVVIETAGQWMHEDRSQIAKILALPDEQVIVRYAAIGGAFGGREDLGIQHLLAVAAWKLRRPVTMTWSREESILSHHKRHPIAISTTWGAMRDGTIVAVRADLLADGGAYASTSVEVMKAATLMSTGPYVVPNVALHGRVAYTNNIPSGAFRGFGAPQAQFASETMVTRLSHALGIDPIAMRLCNLYQEGSFEPTQGSIPTGVGATAVLQRCLAEARIRFGYGQEQQSERSHLKRGVAIASGIKNVGYSFGFPEQATATVELHGESTVEWAVVRVGAADVGQGAHQTLCQIAAATLNIGSDVISMICADTDGAPDGGSASASRMTTMVGRAVQDACLRALVSWRAGAHPAIETHQYRPPATTALDPSTTSGRPNFSYGYVAQAVHVEVDIRTGLVQVLGVVSVHDVGRVINRMQLEGQIEGAVAQAIGYALLENFQMKDGQVLTPSFSTYLLPTSLDVPDEIFPVFLETPDPTGPYGARGVAEMPMVPMAAAIAAAIHDATGVWLTSQPMTPEKVLSALRAAREPVIA